MTLPQVIKDYSVSLTGDTQYQDKFCNMLVNHMAEGKTFASFGAVVGVGHRTLKKWEDESETFKLACELAEVCSLSYWEDIAQAQATGLIKGSSTTLLAMLKNNFSSFYKDKTEVEHSGGVIFKIDTGIPLEVPKKELVHVENEEDLL